MRKKKIYYAAGWFGEKQEEEHTRIYNTMRELPHIDIFNPKLDGGIVNPKGDLAQDILDNNLKHMRHCDLAVVITDYKDMGTLWESGYLSCLRKPIIYYCETLGDKPFNLMLAKTGYVARNERELQVLLSDLQAFKHKKKYNYEGIIE